MLGRKRTAAIAASLIACAGVGVNIAGTPASAEPDIKDVKAKVDKLYHQAEIASENYNTAKARLDSSQGTLTALNADLGRQQKVVDQLRDQVAALAVQQYQGQSLSTAGQVVLSKNPDAFIDNLNAMSTYNSQRGQVMSEFGTQLKRLKLRKQRSSDEVADLAKLEKRMAKSKDEIDKKSAAAKAELNKLEDEAAAKLLGRRHLRDRQHEHPGHRSRGRRDQYAMAQVGDSYVWGAAGPERVRLLRSDHGRLGPGRRRPAAQLAGPAGLRDARLPRAPCAPGDLVFYYSPVSHVGMYIGSGMIVHAANPGAGVRVDRLHSMPYSGAVRPG